MQAQKFNGQIIEKIVEGLEFVMPHVNELGYLNKRVAAPWSNHQPYMSRREAELVRLVWRMVKEDEDLQIAEFTQKTGWKLYFDSVEEFLQKAHKIKEVVKDAKRTDIYNSI
jgi:hypothetical protein